MGDINEVVKDLPIVADLIFARYKDATERQDIIDWLYHYNMVTDAVELLQKQVPMPIKVTSHVFCKMSICPSCNAEIDYMFSCKFCRHCGQAIIWEDES